MKRKKIIKSWEKRNKARDLSTKTLSNCPFCGARPIWYKENEGVWRGEPLIMYSIGCNGCGCGSCYSPNKKLVEETWNQRTNEK